MESFFPEQYRAGDGKRAQAITRANHRKVGISTRYLWRVRSGAVSFPLLAGSKLELESQWLFPLPYFIYPFFCFFNFLNSHRPTAQRAAEVCRGIVFLTRHGTIDERVGR